MTSDYEIRWSIGSDDATGRITAVCPLCNEKVEVHAADGNPHAYGREVGLMLYDHLSVCRRRGRTFRFALDELFVLPDGTLLTAYRDPFAAVPYAELRVPTPEELLTYADAKQRDADRARADVEAGRTRFRQAFLKMAEACEQDALTVREMVEKADELARRRGN